LTAASREEAMGMVLLRELDDRFQADLWSRTLDEQGVPHLVRSFEDTAYDGLFVSQKGFGALYVEEDWLERAREMDAELAGRAAARGLEPASLAARLDHTLLDPLAGPEELAQHLEQCRRMGAAAACVPPWLVAEAARGLAGSGVKVCTVAGFPLGFESRRAKLAETAAAVAAGAQEVDVVLNRGLALSGRLEEAAEEMAAVAAQAAPAAVKVILETSALGPELAQQAARAVLETGAAFVKTGSGFFGPATVAEVGMLKAQVGARLGVKAAGGIQGLDQALTLIEAGADRLGASAGWEIYQEARRLWPGEE
jgi:deoxyribose-phosphate aldolase